MTIKVAIIGVGNCAKSLVEGVALYKKTRSTHGLAFDTIGGYKPEDIQFVLGFDVDRRKIGLSIRDAMYKSPNCAKSLDCFNYLSDSGSGTYEWAQEVAPGDVYAGPILDGVAEHMYGDINDAERFCPYDPEESQFCTASEVINLLKNNEVDVALIYLPVGSQEATEFYVSCCIAAKVPFVNCIPVFIVSNPKWHQELVDAGIPAIGDDMRSQVGASVLSQVLQEMFLDRGADVRLHCQTNIGGNTDFHNMMDKGRVYSKKESKENVITSQNEIRNIRYLDRQIHAGPSDYVPAMGDNKVAHIRIEANGFGGFPITLDCRLSVEDSPNSAGVVIDAIRYLATARDNGIVGPLYGPSAATQKTPPRQMKFSDAMEECRKLANK